MLGTGSDVENDFRTLCLKPLQDVGGLCIYGASGSGGYCSMWHKALEQMGICHRRKDRVGVRVFPPYHHNGGGLLLDKICSLHRPVFFMIWSKVCRVDA
eukprot:XP_001709329.1 Hypothetical protein GL50803_89850 [Giardia lamblia ATCC 50803]